MHLHPTRPGAQTGNQAVAARKEDVVGLAAENGFDDFFRDRRGVQSVVEEAVALVEAFEERGASVALADADGPDGGGFMNGGEFGLRD